ncbi:type II toxin-antitoxin system prevent-host-death family antitoxin [Caulobacter sp. NIBR1757]|uniref:type II toxin-antitoxin system Phd/YefM family antitoxin n=1 Tax=Caulobacter sp. NIBR1757 TaxID=3016000 RepID=UPI0022EFE259|nr:type II toxin-antitoxin system prevent-host-death family antitoxin [Caulobacter sp. NIBR1757]
MRVSVSDAKAQLTEIVKRAEAGEEVVLTRHGMEVAEIVARRRHVSPAERVAVIKAVRASAAKRATGGPSAARSQDFLYDEDGLPG